MRKKKIDILVVEDNLPDYDLFVQGIEKHVGDKLVTYHRSVTGNDALSFLYKKNQHKNAPTPDLIILDLNLPMISGQEFLDIVKKDPVLLVIPVIVFSTSDSDKEIAASYKLHANSYITKTFDINELFEKIRSLTEYWLHTTELPYKTNIFIIDKGDNNEDINN